MDVNGMRRQMVINIALQATGTLLNSRRLTIVALVEVEQQVTERLTMARLRAPLMASSQNARTQTTVQSTFTIMTVGLIRTIPACASQTTTLSASMLKTCVALVVEVTQRNVLIQTMEALTTKAMAVRATTLLGMRKPLTDMIAPMKIVLTTISTQKYSAASAGVVPITNTTSTHGTTPLSQWPSAQLD